QVAAGDSDILGGGVNEQTGRTYVGISGALLVTSDKGFEIAQALSFPYDVNIGAITPVAFNRSVVVPLRGGNGAWVFTVFKDTLPDSAFSPGGVAQYGSLDSLTTAEPQFSASAQAFGIRV